MNSSLVVSLIGVCSSISSVVFAFLAFKRSERAEHKSEGKGEGLMLSDIGYIKACVDRVEKNLNRVDEGYRDCLERLAKAEECITNLKKQVDDLVRKRC